MSMRVPLSVKGLVVLCILLFVSIWVALVNGQPLFHPDSSAYVRGPDFAVVYFLGDKFATAWTQKRTLEGIRIRHRTKLARPITQTQA